MMTGSDHTEKNPDKMPAGFSRLAARHRQDAAAEHGRDDAEFDLSPQDADDDGGEMSSVGSRTVKHDPGATLVAVARRGSHHTGDRADP